MTTISINQSHKENKRLCTIPNCDKPHLAKGWCHMHYQRWRSHGDPMGGKHRLPKGTLCKVGDCKNIQHTRGWCNKHWKRVLRNGDPFLIIDSRGEGNSRAIITEKDVIAIRKDSRRYKLIAADYHMDTTNVSCIKLRKSWAHVK